MDFSLPQRLMHQTTSRRSYSSASDLSELHPDPFQWEKFDDLFDKVFATTSKSSQHTSPEPVRPALKTSRTGPIPGAYHPHRLERSNSSGRNSICSEDSSESFQDAWDDAIKRTKKTVTTTTKRRIIRHTPATPPVPEVPTSAVVPSSNRFLETTYPDYDDLYDSEDDSEEFNIDSPPPKAALPTVNIPTASVGGNTLTIPEGGLTAELHSPVKYVPDWQREAQREAMRRQEEIDAAWAVVTFDMPAGLSREDVHVAFSNAFGAEKLTVSWSNVEVVEFAEAGKLVREKRERKFHRTLPLPVGTKFSNVQANFHSGMLTVVYPKSPRAGLIQQRPVDVLQLTR